MDKNKWDAIISKIISDISNIDTNNDAELEMVKAMMLYINSIFFEDEEIANENCMLLNEKGKRKVKNVKDKR